MPTLLPAVICCTVTAVLMTIVLVGEAITSGTVAMALTNAPGYAESVMGAAARMPIHNVASIVRVS